MDAILLQTLDTDGDHTDGIEISPEVAALFDASSLEVDPPVTTFQSDTGLQTLVDEAKSRSLFSEDRVLVQREDALRALSADATGSPD